MASKGMGKKIAEKFRKEWAKNNHRFSDGKSIEIWIRQNIEDELEEQSDNTPPFTCDIDMGKENPFTKEMDKFSKTIRRYASRINIDTANHIEFAEWVGKYFPNRKMVEGRVIWCRAFLHEEFDKDYTTEELYKLYLIGKDRL